MGEVKKDLRSTLARVDWDAFKEVDPRNEEFQSNMYKKAIALADKMLDDAMHEEGVGPKAKALDAFIKYRAHLNTDTTYPMELLLQLTPEQIEVLKANLKEKSLLKGFQSAKLTLNDLFDLPKREDKQTKNKEVKDDGTRNTKKREGAE